MSAQLKAWIKRNEDALRAEYRSYGIAHDYCPDGLHRHFHTFDAYAANEYAVHLDMQKFLNAKGGA